MRDIDVLRAEYLEVCAALVEKNGYGSQLLQAQEECAEFISVISHLCRGREGARAELLEELWDAYAMLLQTMLVFTDGELADGMEASLVKLRRQLNVPHW